LLNRTGKREFEKILFNFSYYLISGVLLFSGITKLIDPAPLIETLKAIQLFPDEIVIFISTILQLVGS
ncbi:MAG: hypothetical protein K9H48_21725, partial [Melioribacteraceae bacterium]|nr:hypothetical protein [Melioribacteraceae bacterium]